MIRLHTEHIGPTLSTHSVVITRDIVITRIQIRTVETLAGHIKIYSIAPLARTGTVTECKDQDQTAQNRLHVSPGIQKDFQKDFTVMPVR